MDASSSSDLLLLQLARTRISDARCEELAARLADKDYWPELLAAADAQGVLPLVSHALTTRFADLLPPGARARLMAVQASTTSRNLRLLAQLREVSQILEKGGVPVVSLKGPVMTAQVYGHLGSRASNDLDILVPRERVEQAVALLEAAGQRLCHGRGLDTRVERDFFLHDTYDYAFFRAGDPAHIELHWHPTSRFFSCWRDDQDVWQRVESVEVEGRTAQVLAPNDLVLLLCAHVVKEGFWGLRYLCDLNEAVTSVQERIDWDSLMGDVERAGGRRVAITALTAARGLMGTPVPDELSNLAPATRGELALAAAGAAHMRRNVAHCEHRRIGMTFQLRCMASTRMRLVWLAGILHPCSAERCILRLPRWLWWVYYPFRCVRLVYRVVWRLVRRIRGKCRPA